MKYKAVVKSSMEIIGKDVKAFELRMGGVVYYYAPGMYALREKEIIVVDSEGRYDYYDEPGRRHWLKSWLKDIRPIEEKWRAFKKGEMSVEYINYLYRWKDVPENVERPFRLNLTDSILIFYNFLPVSPITLFREWEVSKDNGKTWEPVGVKE